MKINLAIFNHLSPDTNDTRWITDQISFVKNICKEYFLDIDISYTLDPNALNIMIENFNDSNIDSITTFCRKYQKKIAVIMTEHLHKQDDKLKCGNYFLSEREYIGNLDMRIFSLCAISEDIIAFLTLGELPQLIDLQKIIYSKPVYRIAYPKINSKFRSSILNSKFDLAFSGTLTEYRRSILKELSKYYKVTYREIMGDDKKREDFLCTAKMVINIPQNPQWEWISPMRVIYNLEIGLPSVHYGKGDNTKFYKRILKGFSIDCVLQDPQNVFKQQLNNYNSLKLNMSKFIAFLNIWAETEGIY